MEKENVFMNEGLRSSKIHYGIREMHPNNHDEELNCSSSSFYNPIDQTDPFESALSSMVSSPTASNANVGSCGENIVLRELIGRLGSICSNSGEININNSSANTSLYSTPLNSPPKLNLSMMENMHQLAPFSSDPGFAERAARFSCFAEINNNNNSQPLKDMNKSGSYPILEDGGDKKRRFSWVPEDSRENSTVSQQIPAGEIDANPRKRKSIPKGKGKAKEPAPTAKDPNIASENSEWSGKRSKSEEDGSANDKDKKEQSKEPPKDYIHVRARRGQATDAHSLAERVRREKISERMKVLQDLVPGCNKVTGKAVMLDEIINYVQSLQRQVEFLSMKLATVNPRMDFNMEAHMPNSKDMMYQSRGSLPHNIYASDNYHFQSQPNLDIAIPSGTEANNFSPAFVRNQSMQLPPIDNFSDTASQVSTFWEDDLHSVVQMGFGQNQTQSFQGILSTAQMKLEL